MSSLEIQGLDVDLAGRPILRGVELVVFPGECVAVIGANGVGKTTLLRVVLGLQRASAGRVRVLGTAPPCSDVGHVVQDAGASLLPWLSVRDNVILPLRLRGAGADPARALAVARARLDSRSEIDLDARPHELSGGQRQLVALMRALVTSPRLLVLDEPLSAIDAPSRVRLRAELRASCETPPGSSLLFTTHDLDDVVELATRVVLLEGRPASVGRSIVPAGAEARRDITHALAEPRS